jgi:serine/threonine protein phosphatase PrpC
MERQPAMTVRTSTGKIPPPAAASAPTSPDAVSASQASPMVRLDVSALSHTGHHRENNEDHFYVAKFSRALQTITTSLPDGDLPAHAEEANYVMIVADGMGGHAAGEVASRMAIATLIKLALDVPDWILRVDEGYRREIVRRSRTRVQKVGATIVEHGQRDPALKGMGTTLTLARSLGRELMITHVGDSRAYLMRGQQLHRLTRDHTYAQLLVDIGQLDAADAATSQHRHVLTNTLGGASEEVHVDTDRAVLEDGDRVLLCSDGLTDLVDDETILRLLGEATGSKEACERLVQEALDRGGRDNVTVIVASFRLPPSTMPAETPASPAVSSDTADIDPI